MKKSITFISVLLLVVSVLLYVIYDQYQEHAVDRTPPKISCESDTIYAEVSVTQEELLKGVKATDDESGDVSDTLVIADISNFISENTRVITYAAVDDSLNVGKTERTLVYTDYKAPEFSLKAPLSFAVGSRVNILGNVEATSSLDGDITSKIRYGLDSVIDNLAVGEYPVEFRVTDSCGKTTYFETVIEIFDGSYSGIDVTLKDYLIYLPKGAKFDEKSYYKDSSIEGELVVVSNVNTKKTGTYYVDYFVNGVNINGKSRLTVIVY